MPSTTGTLTSSGAQSATVAVAALETRARLIVWSRAHGARVWLHHKPVGAAEWAIIEVECGEMTPAVRAGDQLKVAVDSLLSGPPSVRYWLESY